MTLLSLSFWVLLIAGVGAGVWWLVRHDARELRLPAARLGQAGPDTAMEILRQRFARGEIDRNEFEERRRVLST